MAKRDLKLNSLSRFSKESLSLTLEEHGHCEVPAGCGGVVLRWINPGRGIPLKIWVYVAGKSAIYLDGAEASSSRPIVEFGQHTVAFEVEKFDPRYTVLTFAALADETPSENTRMSGKTGERIAILSSADGSWKYSATEPQDDSWMGVDFDDSMWLTLTRNAKHQPPPNPEQDEDSYRLKRLKEFGAESLGIAGQGVTRMWIRKRFSLSKE